MLLKVSGRMLFRMRVRVLPKLMVRMLFRYSFFSKEDQGVLQAAPQNADALDREFEVNFLVQTRLVYIYFVMNCGQGFAGVHFVG